MTTATGSTSLGGTMRTYQLVCGHAAEVPGPAGATTGRAWCDRCGESAAVAPACRHCGRPIRQGDDVAPWVHTDTGNGFCDVEGPADAVAGRRMPPQERYEAEPQP